MSEHSLTLYCAICGAPLMEDDRYKVPLWFKSAVVLSEASKESKEISETAATVEHASQFQLVGTGKVITANCTNPFWKTFAGFCLATHQSCLAVLKQNLSQRRPCDGLLRSPGQIWTMRHVWQCLNHRWKATAANGQGPDGPIYRLLAPHNYYMPEFSEIEWDFDMPLVDADPWAIPTLSSTVSQKLRHLRSDQSTFQSLSTENENLAALIKRLPGEILDNILSFLCPLTEIPLQCTRTLPPFIWRDRLLDGKLIPFIWDLDATIVAKSAGSEGGKEADWDWELLARQLAQKNVFEEGQILSDAPAGLINRRRIWDVVNDMYFGDVQPTRKNVWGHAPRPVPVPIPE